MGQEVEQIKTGMGGSLAELSSAERKALETMQRNAEQASSIVSGLLQVIEDRGDRIPTNEIGSVLRAASDAQAKSVDGIQKLTGRDKVEPQSDLGATLDSLAARGLLRMSVEIGPERG